MRTLGFLTVALGSLLSVAACSSAPPGDSIADPPAPSKKHEARPVEETPPETPPPATPAPVPTPPAPDAASTNGVKDGDESDVDCGGLKAKACVDGKTCKINGDCANNICTSGTCKPPAVATHYCADLGPCCNSLASTVEKLACLGIQFAGKEIACQGEAALCSIGGIGGTPCSNLAKCCDKMAADGYPGDYEGGAIECRRHNTGNASTCSSYLSSYQGNGWCD
jgi:hypothetical protein